MCVEITDAPNSSGNVQKHGHLLRFQVNGRWGKIFGVHVIYENQYILKQIIHTSCCFKHCHLTQLISEKSRLGHHTYNSVRLSAVIMKITQGSFTKAIINKIVSD